MSLRLPDHTPATLGDVRAVSLAALLAQAETPCTSGCNRGTIDNSAAVRAWEFEHAEEIAAFRADRMRRHSAMCSAEESALIRTEPRSFLSCDCNGTGFLLTADGRALIEFLDRHRPQDHYHSGGWA